LAGGVACASGGAPPPEGSGARQVDADRRCQLGVDAACAELAKDCESGRAKACTGYGQSVQNRDHRRSDEAARWFRRGCELGDLEGCESYGFLQANRREVALAAWGFERSCKMGRLSGCHMFGRMLLHVPAQRAEAAAVFEANCARGFGASCTAGALLMGPLLGPLADCKRAAALAEKTCASREAMACAVSDGCKAVIESERAAAVERLRLACDRRVALACFYWADAQAEPPPAPEKVRAAYEIACQDRSSASGVACSRLAGLRLASATTPADAARPLSFLSKACGDEVGEACCVLADAYTTAKWVSADRPRVAQLRAKACALGCSRCCSTARETFLRDRIEVPTIVKPIRLEPEAKEEAQLRGPLLGTIGADQRRGILSEYLPAAQRADCSNRTWGAGRSSFRVSW
jgi:TPR repeat protein